MARIVLSVYRCDPFGVSEAYSGFMTAAGLAGKHPVLLCTPTYNVASIRRWVRECAPDRVRANLEVLGIRMPNVDGRLGALGQSVKPGFFVYDRRAVATLRRSQYLRDASVIWHRTPVSFRFRSSLYTLGVPFIVGPIAGGLRPPEALSDFFRGEGALYRLRRFDSVLLGSETWMKPLDRADVLLAACDYVRNDILPQRLRAKTLIVPDTGVDLPDSLPAEARVDGPFTILFVGRLVRYKAPTLAIEAFARFLQLRGDRADPARLVVVGDGPEKESCLSLAASRGVIDSVRFAGALTRLDVESEYRSADVFLFPSLTEAAGYVYLEAMRASLPLVVTANGGGQDIPDDDAAVKVPIAPYAVMVEGFAKALCDLAADPIRRRSMGAAGYQCVREKYVWPVIADKLLAAVEQAGCRATLA